MDTFPVTGQLGATRGGLRATAMMSESDQMVYTDEGRRTQVMLEMHNDMKNRGFTIDEIILVFKEMGGILDHEMYRAASGLVECQRMREEQERALEAKKQPETDPALKKDN